MLVVVRERYEDVVDDDQKPHLVGMDLILENTKMHAQPIDERLRKRLERESTVTINNSLFIIEQLLEECLKLNRIKWKKENERKLKKNGGTEKTEKKKTKSKKSSAVHPYPAPQDSDSDVTDIDIPSYNGNTDANTSTSHPVRTSRTQSASNHTSLPSLAVEPTSTPTPTPTPTLLPLPSSSSAAKRRRVIAVTSSSSSSSSDGVSNTDSSRGSDSDATAIAATAMNRVVYTRISASQASNDWLVPSVYKYDVADDPGTKFYPPERWRQEFVQDIGFPRPRIPSSEEDAQMCKAAGRKKYIKNQELRVHPVPFYNKEEQLVYLRCYVTYKLRDVPLDYLLETDGLPPFEAFDPADNVR
jgi:hypothetical protein